MEDILIIYPERLKKDQVEQLSGEITPEQLEIQSENAMRILSPISFEGQAYLANAELIICLEIEAKYEIPCSLCNTWATHSIKLKPQYITPKKEEILSGVYDLSNEIRERLLLEIPSFLQCQEKECTNRQQLQQFLVQKGESKDFSSLTQELNKLTIE